MTKEVSKVFKAVVFLLFAWPTLFGQQVVYQKLDWPASTPSPYMLATGDDDRVWMVGTGPLPNGQIGYKIYAQDPPGSSTLTQVSPADKSMSISQSGFFPTGKESLFGEPYFAYFGDIQHQIGRLRLTASRLSVTGDYKAVCKDYTFDNGAKDASKIDLTHGPMPQSDGSYYYTGNTQNPDKSKTYWVFKLGKPKPDASCDLASVVSSDREITYVAKLGNKYLAKRTLSDDVMEPSSEAALLDPNGPAQVLVGTKSSANPRILATIACDVVYDRLSEKALITFRDTSTHAVTVDKNGTIEEVYSSATDSKGLVNAYIRGVGFRYPWVLLGNAQLIFGGAHGMQWYMRSLALVNVETRVTNPIADVTIPNNPLGFQPSGFVYPFQSITSQGTVNLIVQDSEGNHPLYWFQTSIPGITTYPAPTASFTADPTPINPGDKSTLSWATVNAFATSIDNGVGSVPLTGTQTVTPSATTTYTLTASGLGGTTTAKVTITVTPAGPPKPVVEKIIPATGSTQSGLAPGGLFSIYGTDLCGIITDSTVVPLINATPFDVGRCRVLIDGNYTPLTFGITWATLAPHQSQINGQLSFSLTPGTHTMLVERRRLDDSLEDTSEPVTITIAPLAPSLFGAPQFGQSVLLQDNNSWEVITDRNPAKLGSILVAYGTGFGLPQIPLPDGKSPSDMEMREPDLVQTPAQAWVKVKKPNGQYGSYKALTYYTLFCPPFVGVQQLAFQIPAELEMDPDSTTAYLIITQGDQQTPEVAFPLSPAKQ